MKHGKTQHIFASAVFASMILTASSQAVTIFTDTFDSGTGAWRNAGNNGSLTNVSGQLSWKANTTSGTGVREVIGRSFPTLTLGNGDFIRLTIDYTQNSATTGAADIYRLGIFDFATPVTAASWSQTTNIGAYSGYSGFFRDNSASGNVLRYENATDTSDLTTGPTNTAAIETISTNTDIFNVVPGTQYKLSFELTRVSSIQMDVLFKLTSMDGLTTHQTISGTTANVVSTFDAVIFRNLSGTAYEGSLIDNATLVSSIPETRAALLGGLGLFALMRRRRA